MLDADVVAVSPSSVWRVLQRAGLPSRWKGKPSRKGTGFEYSLGPHQHWHIDISYINVSGTFYYRCILDGYIRSIVHWGLRKSKSYSNERGKSFRKQDHGSFLKEGRSSSRGISRSSFASQE